MQYTFYVIYDIVLILCERAYECVYVYVLVWAILDKSVIRIGLLN